MSKINPEYLRHSAAHLLAHAIFELYPNTLFGIGPATKDGFFYDIIHPTGTFKQDDLLIIAEKMKEIVKRDLLLTHKYIDKNEGKLLFQNNKFKLDIINTQISDDVVGIAEQGNFIDLCKGGHVHRTGQLEHFLLTHISGSYWRADKNKDQMQRISGIIFETEQELNDYIFRQKELEKYDHRIIGCQMELFGIHEEGPGFPFIYPKGMKIINALVDFMRTITGLHGYQEIKTPALLNQSLWKKSGHYVHYKDNMYSVSIDEEEFAIKPMNCPGAFIVYNSRPRSYRELPLRLSEFGYVHRHELSGTLHGMTRVRAFTQDDAHIFCALSQVKDEIKLILKLITMTMEKAKLPITKVVLSTRPDNAAGSVEIWDQAISELKSALDDENQVYSIAEKDGAFYGPKIGIEMEDNFGRVWSCGTIQLDFVQPENFDLSYKNNKGEQERLVVIHQAMFGSLERFLAILIEHHRGKLPFWLAPVQVRIIPISVDQHEYAKKLSSLLMENNFRVMVSCDDVPLNAKLQSSIMANDFLTIIIGKKEIETDTLSIRYNYTNEREIVSQNSIVEKLKIL